VIGLAALTLLGGWGLVQALGRTAAREEAPTGQIASEGA
jgi:hypothetical protein